jgi:hypothetical protein
MVIYGKKQSDCTLQMPPDDSIKKGILQVTVDSAKQNSKYHQIVPLPRSFIITSCRYHLFLFILLYAHALCGNGDLALSAGVHEWGALDDTTSDGELRAVAGEEGVDIASALATLVDAPDDEGLSTTAVTSGEDTGKVGVVVASRCLNVLAAIKLDGVGHDSLLRAQEAHGEQDKVGREELLATLDLLHVPTTRGGLCPLNTDGVNTLDIALSVIDKVLGHDTVLTWVLAHVSLDLVVTVVGPEDTRPLRPWVVASTLSRGLGQQLEVDDGLGAVTNRGTNAVVTSVATTNDDDVLVLGGDVGVVGKLGVEEGLGILVQELHGIVDTVQVAVGDRQVTSDGSTSGEDDSVELAAERVKSLRALLADSDTSLECDTLSGEEVNTALDDLLVELHVGDTIHEQTTAAVGALVDSDGVTSLVELIGASKTSRTGTNDGNGLARAVLRRRRHHPAHLETAVDDSTFNRLDADRILIDAENAGTLARSRADTTGELREVVGLFH